MSAVWIRRDDAQRGSLPARCARSGRRVISRYAHDVSTLPAWVEWLTWTRLWPLNRGEDVAAVVLPLLPRWQQVHTRLRQLRDATAVVLPLALLVMLLSDDGLVESVATWTAVGAAGLHLVAAALGLLLTVDVRPDTTGHWVRLSGVHPEFVAAAEATLPRPTSEPLLAEAQPAPVRSPTTRATGEDASA